MIQRKQTLFLLAVAIISVLLIFIPFQTFQYGLLNLPVRLFPDEIGESTKYVAMTLNLIIMILSIITIFQYKNRIFQYKLANIVLLSNVILFALFFLLDYTDKETIASVSYSFGACLPIISAVFAFLAAHFIKKDEQLVRSADRIR